MVKHYLYHRTEGLLAVKILPIVFLLLFVGCASTVNYLAPYHPSEHKVILILIPDGKAGNAVARVLDRIDNPPFRILSIPEDECKLHSDTEKQYKLVGRITQDIARNMAKSVNATLVVYADPEIKKPSPKDNPDSPPPPQPAGSTTQNFGNNSPASSTSTDNTQENSPSEDIRLAIFDTRTSTVLWYETLSPTPTESAMKEVAKHLVTDSNAQKK